MGTIKHTVWLITAKTNLHVGNENSDNFGIIDKAVQRDPITQLPCINASSLKGALNEHFSKLDGDWKVVFGSEKEISKEPESKDATQSDAETQNKNNPKEATQKGACSFFDASLIAIPRQQDTDPRQQDTVYPFTLCYSQSIIDDFNSKLALFNVNPIDESCIKHPLDGGKEDLSYEKMNELCSDFELPIIARNRVGAQRNLWYEQVVPRETVFATIISYPDDNETCEEFIDALDNACVQIGANATIGYGYCKFDCIYGKIKK